jgi:O-antigen ligase
VAESAYQKTIAVVKATEIGLALLCALRFGVRADLVNPAFAYLMMLVLGMAHGLYPGLTVGDSLRSFVGSVAPFAFCFCRVPPVWCRSVMRATKWVAVGAVAAGVPLALSGIRPLFVDSGGARLAGLGHPAFLAGVCLPAIYACLVALYQDGRRGDLWLLIGNFGILVLTGARAPFVYAVAVTGLSLVTIRSDRFAVHQRVLLGLAAAVLLPVAVLFAGDLTEIRLFSVFENAAGNLSGRGMLWPSFEAAAARSPWVGWGIGAGNDVISPDGKIVQVLHTWAAHNEYLRMEVEGGQLGRGLLIVLFVVWVVRRTARLGVAERRIMRLVFVAFACHAATDNVLISTPACVLFAFATAVFAGGQRLVLPDSLSKA